MKWNWKWQSEYREQKKNGLLKSKKKKCKETMSTHMQELSSSHDEIER